MFEVHIYITIDKKTPRPQERNYGYVLETKVLENTRTREGFGTINGTYHKAVLAALIEAMGRINQSCQVHIHTEDTFILNMLGNNVHKWAEKDFEGEIANKEQWQQLWSLSTKHIITPSPGPHTYASWLKSEMAKMPSDTVNSRSGGFSEGEK